MNGMFHEHQMNRCFSAHSVSALHNERGFNVDLWSAACPANTANTAVATICRRAPRQRNWWVILQLLRANRHETPTRKSACTVVAAVWGWDVLNTSYPASVHPLWISRQEALYLSGLSVDCPDVAERCVLATRPTWLEVPLGGMDRVYRTHKWAGILAISLCCLALADRDVRRHPEIDDRSRGPRVPKEKFVGLLESAARSGRRHGRVGDLRAC
jgi:hypothetical protein